MYWHNKCVIFHLWPSLDLAFKSLYSPRLDGAQVCTLNPVGFATPIWSLVHSLLMPSEDTLLIFVKHLRNVGCSSVELIPPCEIAILAA